MNYSKLRGRIKEVYGTQDEFAKNIGVSTQFVSRRLTEKAEITTRDVMVWSDALGIQNDEINVYFFTL